MVTVCRECEERKLENESRKIEETGVQADGETIRLHYKEIKECLRAIQKVEKEVEKVP